MNDGAYPLMLYRPGSECRVWGGHDVDTRLVHNDDECVAAMDEGWQQRPDHRPLAMLWGGQ